MSVTVNHHHKGPPCGVNFGVCPSLDFFFFLLLPSCFFLFGDDDNDTQGPVFRTANGTALRALSLRTSQLRFSLPPSPPLLHRQSRRVDQLLSCPDPLPARNVEGVAS